MNKKVTTSEARKIGTEVLGAFNEKKGDIKLKGRPLYNLVGLKKELEKVFGQVQETIVTMIEAHGGTPLDNGQGYKIPDEQQEVLGQKLEDFGKEEIDINYETIILNADDDIPAELLDAAFDFIQFNG